MSLVKREQMLKTLCSVVIKPCFLFYKRIIGLEACVKCEYPKLLEGLAVK